MSSQLEQLRQEIAALASDAQNTAQGLSVFIHKFSTAVMQVRSTVGGSAQQVDKELIQSLQVAEQEVTNAMNALDQASRVARSYAQSI